MKTHLPVASLSVLALVAVLGSACASAAEQKQRHLEQGNQYSTDGEYQSAIIEYRKALQLDDRFGQVRYQLAHAYEKANDLPQALREGVRAADLMPDDSKVQLHAGRLLLLTGHFEDAATRARGMLERDPKNVDALVLLGNASAAQPDASDTRAILERAVEALPEEPRLQEVLGLIETRRGDPAAAESAFKRAVEIAPDALGPRESLAMYYWSSGRSEEAERTLKAALSVDSGSSISRDLAAFYFMEGRNKEAEPHSIKLVAEFPKESFLQCGARRLYTRGSAASTRRSKSTSRSSPTRTARRRPWLAMADADYSPAANRSHDRLSDAIKRMPADLRPAHDVGLASARRHEASGSRNGRGAALQLDSRAVSGAVCPGHRDGRARTRR